MLAVAISIWPATVLAAPAASIPSLARKPTVKAPTLKFQRDPSGAVPNGFTSLESTVAHFTDSSGADLELTDVTPESIGRGMRVLVDDASMLIIDFDVPVMRVSLTFGNDDPDSTQAGDVAVLEVFRRGEEVKSTSVVMNRNDIGDQRIGIRGSIHRRAVFFFGRAGAPIDLIEVIDYFAFSPACVISGTKSRDKLVGSERSNVLCGFGARDHISAAKGNDFAHGGDGNDLIRGGSGADTLFGANGKDSLHAQDGIAGNDLVEGGDGFDMCYIDPGDTTDGCEDIVAS